MILRRVAFRCHLRNSIISKELESTKPLMQNSFYSPSATYGNLSLCESAIMFTSSTWGLNSSAGAPRSWRRYGSPHALLTSDGCQEKCGKLGLLLPSADGTTIAFVKGVSEVFWLCVRVLWDVFFL